MRIRTPARRATRSAARRLASVSAAAASMLLVGCTAAPEGPHPPPFVAVPVADEVPTAHPGQRVAVGEPIALPVTDDSGAVSDVVATAVLGVVAGDPSYWADFENAQQFDGKTPYFAVVQTRWLRGDRAPGELPVLRPFLADGAEAQIIERDFAGTTMGGVCPYDFPDLRVQNGHTGTESMDCVVYAVPAGHTLAELRWHDVPKIQASRNPARNPFLVDPVVWRVDPKPADPAAPATPAAPVSG